MGELSILVPVRLPTTTSSLILCTWYVSLTSNVGDLGPKILPPVLLFCSVRSGLSAVLKSVLKSVTYQRTAGSSAGYLGSAGRPWTPEISIKMMSILPFLRSNILNLQTSQSPLLLIDKLDEGCEACLCLRLIHNVTGGYCGMTFDSNLPFSMQLEKKGSIRL